MIFRLSFALVVSLAFGGLNAAQPDLAPADTEPKVEAEPEAEVTEPEESVANDEPTEEATPEDGAEPEDGGEPDGGTALPPIDPSIFDEELPKTERDILAEWKAASARRQQVIRQLKDLRDEYKTATKAEKRELFTEFRALEFQFQHDPALQTLRNLASEVYEQQPENMEAARFAQSSALRAGELRKAREIGLKLIEREQATPMVYLTQAQTHLLLGEPNEALAMLEILKKRGDRYKTQTALENQIAEFNIRMKAEDETRAAEEAATGEKALPRIRIVTSEGEMEAILFEDAMPNTVANFLTLIEAGTYDGVRVHRVQGESFLQLGHPGTKEWDENADYSSDDATFTIADETPEAGPRPQFTGSLSMASSGPDTAAQQFVVTTRPIVVEPSARMLSPTFGRVVKGLDVLPKITRGTEITDVEVISKRDHDYTPERTKRGSAPTRPDGEEEETDPMTETPMSQDGEPTEPKPESSESETPSEETAETEVESPAPQPETEDEPTEVEVTE